MNKKQSPNNYDGKWLEGLFLKNPTRKKKELGLYLCEVFAIEKSYASGIITRMIANARSIKAREAEAIINFFGEKPEREKNKETIKTPLFDKEKLCLEKNTDQCWELPSGLIPASFQNKNLVIVPVQGDSMSPDLNDGDHVVVDMDENDPSPAGIFVLDNGGGIAIKRLEGLFHQDQKSIRISSSNPHYSPYEVKADQITIIGRVILRIGRI